jgi:hypothetical protein
MKKKIGCWTNLSHSDFRESDTYAERQRLNRFNEIRPHLLENQKAQNDVNLLQSYNES